MADSQYTQAELDRAMEYLDAKLHETLAPKMLGRQIVAQDPDCVGDGIFRARVQKLIEMGDALVSYNFPREGEARDRVEVRSREVDLPVLSKPYIIEKQEMEAFLRQGTNLEAASARSAGKAITRLENQMILQGWKPDGTNYEVKGLYQAAAQSVTDSLDFGTYGNADKAVNAAIAKLETNNVEASAYHLICNPTQMAELRISRNATSGAKEMPEVLESLNNGKENGPGSIFRTDILTAGTAMVIPYDPTMEYFRLLNPLELTTELGQDSKAPKSSPVYGNVYEVLYVDVIDENAICKLTGV